MLTHKEDAIRAARAFNFVPPNGVHEPRSRDVVHDQEQSGDDLLAAVESLQEIVSELLLRNQKLRMALDHAEEVLETPFAKVSQSEYLPNSKSIVEDL